ncbi:MAG: preprotein translocase subunit YajC [Sedimentisphaerales bacterium]|jgi:preprotein translocase subunit YajC
MQNLWIIAEAQVETATATVASQPQASEVQAQPMTQSGQPMVAVDSNTAAPARPQNPFSQSFSWIFLIVIFVVMFFMLREPRRKQKQHDNMVKTLKKNDKVRTIGGIIGTVVDIKDDEIVLKVDESNNTKIRIAPSAVGKNLSEGQ